MSKPESTNNPFLEVRLLAGMTQHECARLLGISQRMWSRLERGERGKLCEPIRKAIYVAALKEMCNYV